MKGPRSLGRHVDELGPKHHQTDRQHQDFSGQWRSEWDMTGGGEECACPWSRAAVRLEREKIRNHRTTRVGSVVKWEETGRKTGRGEMAGQ